jgi:hypothetical protein
MLQKQSKNYLFTLKMLPLIDQANAILFGQSQVCYTFINTFSLGNFMLCI